VIIGISAGATQLGMGGFIQGSSENFTDTFKLVPHYIGVHEEESDWSLLKQAVKQRDGYCKGFGISKGGGLIYHRDSVMETL